MRCLEADIRFRVEWRTEMAAGRALGYPTANIVPDDAMKLLPPDGVYVAKAFVPEPYAAVVNLGVRPTFNGKNRLFEAHLLDFSGDLYGRSDFTGTGESSARRTPVCQLGSADNANSQGRAACP